MACPQRGGCWGRGGWDRGAGWDAAAAEPAPTGAPYPAGPRGWEDLPDNAPLPADGYWDRGVPEGDEEIVPREGDPRIGLPMRTGLLGAAALAWVGALAAWPGVAVLVLVAWSVIARATDLSFTSLVLRRYERGRRRSDVAMAVVRSPWHLVVGIIATAVSLILPVGVALAGIFGSALLLAGTRGGELGPGTPVTLVIGGALGLATLWWGPGGASLRRGSRSVVRRVRSHRDGDAGRRRRPRDAGGRRRGGCHRQGRRHHVESVLRQPLRRLGHRPRRCSGPRRTAYLIEKAAHRRGTACAQRVKEPSRRDHEKISGWLVRAGEVTYRLSTAASFTRSRSGDFFLFHVVACRARKPPALSQLHMDTHQNPVSERAEPRQPETQPAPCGPGEDGGPSVASVQRQRAMTEFVCRPGLGVKPRQRPGT